MSYSEKRRIFLEKNKGREISCDMVRIRDSKAYTAIGKVPAEMFIIPLLKTWNIEYEVYEGEQITKDMPQQCISGFMEQPRYVVICSKAEPEDLTFLQDLSYGWEFRNKMRNAMDPAYVPRITIARE